MNFRTFSEIIQLNKDFYKAVDEHFSQTRQFPWSGWEDSLTYIKEIQAINKEKIKILDLGCGNGRFLKFLIDNNFKDFEYLGLDTNKYLLKEANAHYDVKGVAFKNVDVINDIAKLTEKFNLIVAFGITHHIPSSEFRQKWFLDVSDKLNSNGIFIFTTWNYNRDKRFSQVVKNPPIDRIDISELEEGDYFIGWDNNSKDLRYVHIYSDKEISKIIDSLNMNLISKYSADGKTGNLNDYFLLKA